MDSLCKAGKVLFYSQVDDGYVLPALEPRDAFLFAVREKSVATGVVMQK